MGVEQDGVGLGVISGKFYQVKHGRSLYGNACSAQPGAMACAAGVFALRRVLIAMKLKHSQRQMVAGCYDICGFFIDEEEDGSHKGGRRRASSAARRGVTYRGLFSYITNPMASTPASTAASTSCSRVRPQILMRVRVDRERAGVPTGTGALAPPAREAPGQSGMGCHGSQSYAGVRSGSPQWVS